MCKFCTHGLGVNLTLAFHISHCHPVVATFAKASQTRQGQADKPADEEYAQQGSFADALDASQEQKRHHESRQDERGVKAHLDP